MSSERVALSRRAVVKGVLGLAILFASTSLTPVSFADDAAPSVPFSFDDLSARMRNVAAAAYVPPSEVLPDVLAKLTYDDYRRINAIRARAPDLSTNFGYKLEPFHLGWLFKEPVQLYQVNGDKASLYQFSAADFDYRNPATAAEIAKITLPGVAGFRIDCPLNVPDRLDELVAFQGASYFRALGRGNSYGASARGLVIDSWTAQPEEFPRFSSFYFEKDDYGQPLVFYATLEGPSVAGAFKFAFDPGNANRQETVVDITARFFFRNDIAEIGIAPLTSMFLFADANRSDFDDYRPQVHDSDGLYMEYDNGEHAWRALNNPPSVANSYFAQTNPRAFGLMQRARDFSDYQDDGARYDTRPSILIEPQGDWGEGSVRLIEATAKLEADDNIGAFWVPKTPFRAGGEAEFNYRIRWGDLMPDANGPLAYVVDTRSGQGGVSGVANKETLRKFVVDFFGGPLSDPELDPGTLDVVATISGGQVHYTSVSKLSENGVVRLAIDAEIDTKDPVELRAYLVGNGRQLTETWLYQWRAAA